MNNSDNPENPPSPSAKTWVVTYPYVKMDGPKGVKVVSVNSCIAATIGDPHPNGCQLIGINGTIFWLMTADCALEHK